VGFATRNDRGTTTHHVAAKPTLGALTPVTVQEHERKIVLYHHQTRRNEYFTIRNGRTYRRAVCIPFRNALILSIQCSKNSCCGPRAPGEPIRRGKSARGKYNNSRKEKLMMFRVHYRKSNFRDVSLTLTLLRWQPP
jgi:hypothetical protein